MLTISQIAICAASFAFLLSPAAKAQTSTVTNNLTVSLNSQPANICNDLNTEITITVSGTVTTSSASVTPAVDIYAVPITFQTTGTTSAATCGSGTDVGTLIKSIAFQATGTTYTLPSDQTQYTKTVANLDFCGKTTLYPNWGICAYTYDSTNRAGTLKASKPAVLLNTSGGGGTTTTANPSTTITEVAAGDGQITFKVTTNTTESKFDVCWVEWTDDAKKVDLLKQLTDLKTSCSGGNLSKKTLSGSTYGTATYDSSVSLVWDGVTNGTNYAFRVQGQTGKKWSDIAGPVTPLEAFSTLEAFEGTNGGLSWQCAQSSRPMSVNALLGLFALFAGVFFLAPSRRRRLHRGIVGLTLSSLILIHAVPAMAEGGSWNLGITGSPYKPNLDADKTKFPAYKCLFKDAYLPLIGLEFDFHVADPFGSIQLGFATAYSWANGNALAAAAPKGQNSCDNVTSSSVPVALHMLQIKPRLTYVFDRYVDDFPLVPYVQVGLVGAGYYFTYQGVADKFAEKDGRNPMGIRFGYEAALGVMFALDVLEPSVSSRARAGGVYNHTYLKAEIAYMPINDFGSPGLDFSPAPMFGGMPSGFLGTLGLVIEFQ